MADVKTLNHMGKTFKVRKSFNLSMISVELHIFFQNQVAKPQSQHILKEDDYKVCKHERERINTSRT